MSGGIFVVFGGTGDLSRRMLIPALFDLHQSGESDNVRVLSVARDPVMDTEAMRALALESLRTAGRDAEAAAEWIERIHYLPVGDSTMEEFRQIARTLEELEQMHGIRGCRVFYLAIPPGAFADTVRGLAAAGLNDESSRIVVEKPFGRDVGSARSLNRLLHEHFDETQIYRIDHYLGKETVQNLLVFRFANSFFESIWNRSHVESVQVTVAETLGVGSRGRYYDRAGATRDMVQNHLTQLISLIAMEPPVSFTADSIRLEKVKAVRSITPLDPADVVMGQYVAGNIGDARVPGYLEEPDVPADSKTETYTAARITVDTWRWSGVPFFIRTGKRLPRAVTEIALFLSEPPVQLFDRFEECDPSANLILIRLQPDEGFELHIDVKAPGEPFRMNRLPLNFNYRDAFGEMPGAYRTLLGEILEGDQTLFVHAEETEASWNVWDRVIDAELPMHPYSAGTWGPEAADALAGRGGHPWRNANGRT